MEKIDEDFDLADMYGAEREPKAKRPAIIRPIENKGAKTRKIHVGIAAYEVPNPEYVDTLEKRIDLLERKNRIADDRLIRMETSIAQLQNLLRQVNSNTSRLSSEINKKVDRRT